MASFINYIDKKPKGLLSGLGNLCDIAGLAGYKCPDSINLGIKKAKWTFDSCSLPDSYLKTLKATNDLIKKPGNKTAKKVKNLVLYNILPTAKKTCSVGKKVFKPLGKVANGLTLVMMGNSLVDWGYDVKDYCQLSSEKRAQVDSKGLYNKKLFLIISLVSTVCVIILSASPFSPVAIPLYAIVIVSSVQYIAETSNFFHKEMSKTHVPLCRYTSL